MTGLPSLSRRVDHGADHARRQHALGVVGQHHRAGLRQRRFSACAISAASLSASTGAAVSQSARSRWVE